MGKAAGKGMREIFKYNRTLKNIKRENTMFSVITDRIKNRILILDNSRPKLEVRQEEDPTGHISYVLNPGNRKFSKGYRLLNELQSELRQLKCIHLRLEVERQLSNLTKSAIFL